MDSIDIIFISQSDVANYGQYATLPKERVELFKYLVYPRLIYFKNGFHTDIEIYNYYLHGGFYTDATFSERKKMLNLWDLPGFNGIHIADYLYKHGINSRIINNFDTDFEDLCSAYEASEKKPIIAISTTFHLSFKEVRRMSKLILRKFPEAEILLGGAFINERYMNDEIDEIESTMRKSKIKYIVHSFNSELDFKDLILSIKSENKTHDDVNNIFYLKSDDYSNGEIIRTKKVWNNPFLTKIDSLDNLDLDFVNKTLQIRSASGCPFACAFCSYPTTAGGYFIKELEPLDHTIKHILEKTSVKNIVFIDDTFNVPKARFAETLKILNKHKINWFSFLRVQFITDDIAREMRDSGCKAVFLGIESASDVILKNMNKKAKKAEFSRGIALLNKYGIASMAAFIIGYPGETDETIEENIEFIENSGIDFYTLKEFYYIKQTSIYENREEYGLTGMGAEWKHDTMDSQTASEKVHEMFLRIKNIAFIDPDTTLWSIVYLLDQGFSIEQIKQLQKEANSIMAEQMKNGNFSEDIPAFENIKLLLEAKAEVYAV